MSKDSEDKEGKFDIAQYLVDSGVLDAKGPDSILADTKQNAPTPITATEKSPLVEKKKIHKINNVQPGSTKKSKRLVLELLSDDRQRFYKQIKELYPNTPISLVIRAWLRGFVDSEDWPVPGKTLLKKEKQMVYERSQTKRITAKVEPELLADAIYLAKEKIGFTLSLILRTWVKQIANNKGFKLSKKLVLQESERYGNKNGNVAEEKVTLEKPIKESRLDPRDQTKDIMNTTKNNDEDNK